MEPNETKGTAKIPLDKLRGIERVGNSCHLNTAIQTLFAMPEFREILEEGKFENCEIILELKQLHSCSVNGNLASNEKILKFLMKRNTNMKETSFLSAVDTLTHLYEAICEELTNLSTGLAKKHLNWIKSLMKPTIECHEVCQTCQSVRS